MKVRYLRHDGGDCDCDCDCDGISDYCLWGGCFRAGLTIRMD